MLQKVNSYNAILVWCRWGPQLPHLHHNFHPRIGFFVDFWLIFEICWSKSSYLVGKQKWNCVDFKKRKKKFIGIFLMPALTWGMALSNKRPELNIGKSLFFWKKNGNVCSKRVSWNLAYFTQIYFVLFWKLSKFVKIRHFGWIKSFEIINRWVESLRISCNFIEQRLILI